MHTLKTSDGRVESKQGGYYAIREDSCNDGPLVCSTFVKLSHCQRCSTSTYSRVSNSTFVRRQHWSGKTSNDQQKLFSLATLDNTRLTTDTKQLQPIDVRLSRLPFWWSGMQFQDRPLGRHPMAKHNTFFKGQYRAVSIYRVITLFGSSVTNEYANHYVNTLKSDNIDAQFLNSKTIALKNKGKFVVDSINNNLSR